MDPISQFLNDYNHFISLINGLAFFVLGFAVFLDSDKASAPRLSGPLRMLAGYGFVATVSNWLRMFMLIPVPPVPATTSMILRVVRLLCLILAGLLLMRFA
ncbi:MAG: hypothetical protein P1S60_16665, partial [Anaerolineae bacterium]|nr:hypothetical protein [Anaerolineae bacterium]